MKFHYYYILQDIIGVLLTFVSLRLIYVCLRIMKIRGISKNALILLFHYVLYFLSGLNLLIYDFGVRPWIVSGGIFSLGLILRFMADFKNKTD